ncbi:hypothetical protein EWM64_g1792 [Hericium alpestre]|uniref:RRM domain-containing protein n=1 Tax=Hericium alpestre TaxID=135208 RepID=A0A4Z0A5D0_9AGAM|nr:hypothetical protein EWM64_g1792 [Hericium alpestre]
MPVSDAPSVPVQEAVAPSVEEALRIDTGRVFDSGASGETQPFRPAALAQGDDDSFKTPNVYINGLPPNFPEEHLFEMTREFGPVVSVRTFTRHVSERPSGYGFVLFETVDGAEKCIEALRRYRNLHPSFSKQIHKIPGTSYATLAASASGGLSPSPSISSASDSGTGETFKNRMERLRDEGSTNLYMEGLPLSIDEAVRISQYFHVQRTLTVWLCVQTLTALVNPFPIKSSRFFQTRLSHPPRIIAFVRLESRHACEEIIERLHGRMVRGWNDSGSRISVRFADSAEQRELRRNERHGREEEPSPSRLTMAQAALLNLRGQQIQRQLRGTPSPTLSVNHLPAPEIPRYDNNGMNPSRSLHSRLPMHPLTSEYRQQEQRAAMPPSRSMPAYLDGDGLVDTPSLAQEIDLSSLPNSSGPGRMVDVNGFTPLEQQLILQAQLQARAREEALQANAARVQNGMKATNGSAGLAGTMGKLNLSSKEFVPRGLLSRMQAPARPSDVYQENHFQPRRTQAHHGRPQAAYSGAYNVPSLSPVDFVPSMSEDDFHATAQRQGAMSMQSNQYENNVSAFNNHENSHSRGPTQTIYEEEPETKEHTIRLSSSLDFVHEQAGQAQGQGHMRSTTLPPHFTLGGSVSASGRLGGLLSPDLGSYTGGRNRSAALALAARLNIALPGTKHVDASSPHLNAGASDSPMLVPSPALTYNSSSSRTPSTLSPSTPFFGSFAHAGEGFATEVYKDAGKDGDHGHSVHGHGHSHFGARGKARTGSQ